MMNFGHDEFGHDSDNGFWRGSAKAKISQTSGNQLTRNNRAIVARRLKYHD